MNAHRITVNTIKGLAMDAVEAARSGHPGMPMGAADMAVVLWSRFLRHDPADPEWPDRDRFILSAGHGSMLLYSLLHLAGYEVSVEDLRAFRQWESRTPGHPEYGHTPGVETTTGPLGQGFATGVGMAIAERWVRENHGAEVCDHRIFGIVSDGDLMEGISYEAASLAGHLKLGRIVYLYDDNEISIDGSTDLAFTEDRVARFQAMGWHTQSVDGHDPDQISSAIERAIAEEDRPSLILCRTVIGQGSSLEGSEKTHGAPLGPDEVAATKERLGLDPGASFVVPDEARSYLRGHEGPALRQAWKERVASRGANDAFGRLERASAEALVDAVSWPTFEDGASLATRKAGASVLKAITAAWPEVLGGSADLAGSNGVAIGRPSFRPGSFKGAGSLHFGVREHAMGAILNGMALHGGVIPYGATFLMFHDYMRPAVRLAALMGVGSVFVYTHDSIFLGEDGPTHQPVETLFALRTIPGLVTWRPADARETVDAWKAMLARRDGPSAIVLSRQSLPVMARGSRVTSEDVARGGYILSEPEQGSPQVVLVATGSEVALAVEAQQALAAQGTPARVVSMPSVETFLAQSDAWRSAVLPPGLPAVSIEAGRTWGWERVVGTERVAMVGIDRFGASAPAEVLAEKFGFTVDGVLAAVSRAMA